MTIVTYSLTKELVLNGKLRKIVGGDGSPGVWPNPSLRARGSRPKTGAKNPGLGRISAGRFGARSQTREKDPGREKARVAGEVVEIPGPSPSSGGVEVPAIFVILGKFRDAWDSLRCL